MTGALYDHLAAIIVVGALFISAVVAVPNINYLNLLYVNEQQLRNVALSALQTMLLSPGYPFNWGSDENFNETYEEMERFGLALSDYSSSYTLDSDKVQRLVMDNPVGYLNYTRARQLLGLDNYGFYVKIAPPFNVTSDLTIQGNKWTFDVTVRFNDKKPLPNAVVNVITVCSIKAGGPQEEKYYIDFVEETDTTNGLGKCRIEQTFQQPGLISHNITVIQATVAGVSTVTIVEGRQLGSSIAEANIVNDEVILTRPERSDPNDNRWICDIAVYTQEGLITIYKGNHNDTLNYGSKNLWEKNFPGLKSMKPLFLFVDINAVEKQQGRRGTLVIGPYPNYVGSRIIGYGGTPQVPSVKIQRAVDVDGMTYIVDLVLWKER